MPGFKCGLLALLLVSVCTSMSSATPLISPDDRAVGQVVAAVPVSFGVTQNVLFATEDETEVTPPAHQAVAFLAPSTSFSAVLAGIPPDGRSSARYRADDNVVIIDIRPDAYGVAVLAIDTALFHRGTSVDLRLNGAKSVLINVTIAACPHSFCGYIFDASVHFNGVMDFADQVTWNFTNATALSFETLFGGAVVTPMESRSIRPAADAAMMLHGFLRTGQLRRYAFADIPPGAVLPVRTRDPEPACWCY